MNFPNVRIFIVSINDLTWSAHPQIADISRAWFKGCSIISDASHDRKWLGALYEVVPANSDYANKANSLEQVEAIINEDYEKGDK